MTAGDRFLQHVEGWLGRAIEECERRLGSLEFQLKVDRGYVASPEADPRDIAYYRCQIELNVIERECARKKLAVLRRWALSEERDAGGKTAPRPAEARRGAAE